MPNFAEFVVSEISAEFRGIRVEKPPKMCLFLTVFRGKCPFFWDLRTCETPLPRNSAEFARNSAEFEQWVAHFSNIGHFFIILQQKSCFKFFFGHFGLSQTQISQIHARRQKQAKSAHRGPPAPIKKTTLSGPWSVAKHKQK